jgi:hypothetical protein
MASRGDGPGRDGRLCAVGPDYRAPEYAPRAAWNTRLSDMAAYAGRRIQFRDGLIADTGVQQ